MTRRIALVALVVAVVVIAGLSYLVFKPDTGTTRSSVRSAALGRDMPIEVFSPPGQPCQTAPVLLLFHGRGGDERQWMEGAPFDGVDIDVTARRLIEAGQIQPITIVSASIDDSYGVDSAPANDGYDHGPYGTYIVDELIPAVAERYGSGGRSPLSFSRLWQPGRGCPSDEANEEQRQGRKDLQPGSRFDRRQQVSGGATPVRRLSRV